jgi:hippurate hydrolase
MKYDSIQLKEVVEQYTLEQLDYLLALHFHYHANPELSLKEYNTSKRQAEEYTKAGCDEVMFIAETGVVGIIRNGEGPVVLFRNDHDALPIQEENEVAYKSKVAGVGHLCGHSMVPAISIGLAKQLIAHKSYWNGTVVFVSQLGEEGADGARKMIEGGLFSQIPAPDMALAWHCSPTLAGGKVGIRPGPAMALTAHPEIIVKGLGGHGGYPSTTKDPVVLAAAIILRLQTIVSREINPIEPAVVTVGSVVTNTQKGSVIPSEVHLKLTVRCFSEAVYLQIMAAVERICRGEAIASGLDKSLFPVILPYPRYTKPVINDPALCNRLEAIFKRYLGDQAVLEEPPYTFGEDFAYFDDNGRIPIAFLWLGSVDPEKFDADGRPKCHLEPLHSPKFLPHPTTTLTTGVNAMTIALLDIMAANA